MVRILLVVLKDSSELFEQTGTVPSGVEIRLEGEGGGASGSHLYI